MIQWGKVETRPHTEEEKQYYEEWLQRDHTSEPMLEEWDPTFRMEGMSQ